MIIMMRMVAVDDIENYSITRPEKNKQVARMCPYIYKALGRDQFKVLRLE